MLHCDTLRSFSILYKQRCILGLQVNIIIEADEMFRRVHRPQDLMPRMVTDGVKRLLSFDVLSVQGATCLFTNMTAVTKTSAR